VTFEITVFLLKDLAPIAVIFGEFYYNKSKRRHSIKETEQKLLPTFQWRNNVGACYNILKVNPKYFCLMNKFVVLLSYCYMNWYVKWLTICKNVYCATADWIWPNTPNIVGCLYCYVKLFSHGKSGKRCLQWLDTNFILLPEQSKFTKLNPHPTLYNDRTTITVRVYTE
jgi:hypothetical protein